MGWGPDLAARGDLASAITCWRSLIGALRRARSGDTFRGRPSIGLRNRGVAPIGPCGGGVLRSPEAALVRRLSRVAPFGSLRPPRSGGGPDWTVRGAAPIGRHEDRPHRATGGDSHGGPHSGHNLGGGPNRAARVDLLLEITCWRSLTGTLGRTCAGDTFQGPVLDRPVLDRPVPGVALIGAPHPGGGPDWTLWRWTSSSTGGGSLETALAGGPIGVTAWGWRQPGRSRRPRLGNQMLALSDWRTRTDMCRRHVPGSRSRGKRSGGGPDWASAFGGWHRLDPVEVEFFVHRGRLSRDSRGWPCWGRSLGSQLGGWPQPGRLWRPRLGNHMLALSDGRSQAGTYRRHAPGTRFGGGPHWASAFGGWPRLDLVPGVALIGAPHLGGGPDWIWQCWPSSDRLGATLTGHASSAACGVLSWTAPPWRSLTGAL